LAGFGSGARDLDLPPTFPAEAHARDGVVGDERAEQVTHLELQAVRVLEIDRFRPGLVVDNPDAYLADRVAAGVRDARSFSPRTLGLALGFVPSPLWP